MQATILDLRYKMKDVLKALNRRERVKILYHGKVKGVIEPSGAASGLSLKNHPFFAMHKDEKEKVQAVMERLRGGRHRAL